MSTNPRTAPPVAQALRRLTGEGADARRDAPAHALDRLTELFDRCADAVVVVGLDGQVAEADRGARAALGLAPGDPVDQLFDVAERPRAAAEILPRAVREGRWDGTLAVRWGGAPTTGRAVLFGHRAPEGQLLATSVIVAAPAVEDAATFDDLQAGSLALSDALDLALGAARALAAVHRHGLVHRDLQARSFLLPEGGAGVRVTGLWSARPLAPGMLPAREVTAGLEGALPYLSPELTGRVNRPVDRRSDLYSLGVVLYELLSGRLPLEADDTLEWVHAHVARVPDPLRAHTPAVPEVVDRIVMRLLAKSPEDRYQSAAGVVADLARCVAELRDTGVVGTFALGSQDVSDVFAVPQRLYGRTTESDALLGAFTRVNATRRGELVLVSGPAGVGKSSLVQSLRESVGQTRGTFVTGKLDGVARDVPYAPFAQAVGELVQQALAEPPARLRARTEQLRAAVGANGRIICDLVPRAELLLGPCPPVGDLPLPEAQRRVHRVVGDVIDVFASEHPVVLFVDDLQWADPASVQLLVDLAGRDRPTRLVLVGGYRDDELEPTHPLTLALHELRGSAGLLELPLGPLDAPALQSLLEDTLRAPPAACAALATLVRDKTGGTPYYVLQFLHALHQRGLISLDPLGGGWRWDRDEIAGADVTDNVVDIMTERLRRLPPATQQVLMIAACLGDRCDLSTLAIAARRPAGEVESDLWDALRERLLVAREPGYRFSHDRVRQAAYALIDPAEAPAVHLAIGRALLADTPAEALEARVFAIVGHLDAGAGLIDDHAERLRCAELHLLAGHRAMAATALRSAARYLRTGIELLPEDAWEAAPRLSLDLHLGCARCEHAGGDLDETERLVDLLLAHAREPGDIAAAAQMRVETRLARSQPAEAAQAGIDALARLGVVLDADLSDDEIDTAAARMWDLLDGRPIESLLELPMTDDPRINAVAGLLAPVMTAAFLGGSTNLGIRIMLESAFMSLEHGNAALSPLLHALLGSVRAARFGRPEEGRRLGHAAHALAEAAGIDALAAQTGVYVGLGSVWTDPYPDCLPFIRAGFEHGVAVGDLAHAAYCGFFSLVIRFAAGDPLDEVLRDAEPRFAFAEQMKLPENQDALSIVERAARSLRGETTALGDYGDADFDDEAFADRLRTSRPPFDLAIDTLHRLGVLVIAHRVPDALAAAQQFDEVSWAVAYHPMLALQEPYGALARAAAWDTASPAERDEIQARLIAAVARLDAWAVHAPGNFLAPAKLVAAELARIEGRAEDAARGYEAAITAAAGSGLIHYEALARERAGRWYLRRELTSVGLACLHDARDRYARWGATAKVAQLDAEFGVLAAAPAGMPATPPLDALAVARSSQAISGELDLEQLPATLLRLAVAAAGAQAGRLLLVDDEGRIDMVAVAETADDEVHVRRAAADDDDGVPQAVTDYVLRTRERVLLRDARADPTFGADAVITARGIRSLLCQPVVRHSALVGLLLLEHRLVDDAFPEDRLAAVEILAAQAAISVETARLYQDVREENRIRRRTEAELRASEEQFRTLVESAPDAILITDERGRIVLVNSRVEQLFGYTRDALEGSPAEELVGEIDWTRIALSAEGTATLELERAGRRRDGASFPVEVTLSPLERPGATWTIGIVRDVTERKRLEHELEHAADHDALTGLFNRPRFERELAAALERVGRNASAAVLLVLDLDHIRDINDSLGPQVGDELIRALAHALRERLRPTDILARLGGDEYAFILSRTDVPGAQVVGDELLELVRTHALVSDGMRVRTTASIGIAPITVDAGNAQDLLAAADVALDQAKEAGRDRAVVYTPDDGRRAAARHTWSERIRHALEHEEFTLHEQPILDLRTNEITHAELLIRMEDDGELIAPAEFLPTAERTGLITAIDRWVIREGARLAATSGGRLLELNLSAKSLADAELPGYIQQEVEAAGADPANLVFEITETAAIANLPSAAALAERLTALGCHFALDDFGVGFGSFYYLKRLPLHYIKIDGDFIQTLTRSPTDQHVTKAIVGVAQGLGLKTIAEFVEDAETLELLRTYGVDYAQGFHVGRPGPVD